MLDVDWFCVDMVDSSSVCDDDKSIRLFFDWCDRICLIMDPELFFFRRMFSLLILVFYTVVTQMYNFLWWAKIRVAYFFSMFSILIGEQNERHAGMKNVSRTKINISLTTW